MSASYPILRENLISSVDREPLVETTAGSVGGSSG